MWLGRFRYELAKAIMNSGWGSKLQQLGGKAKIILVAYFSETIFTRFRPYHNRMTSERVC